MRLSLPSMPAYLSLTLALTATTIAASAQNHTILNMSGKSNGAIAAGGSKTSSINTIIDASSIMQITRSNIGEYSKMPKTTRLTITKQVDAASPQLLQAHNTNEVIPRVSLTLYKPGDNSKYKIITLEDVIISGLTVKKTAKDPDSKPVATQKTGKTTATPAAQASPAVPDTEEISFTFQRISIAYFFNGSTSTSDDWNASN